MASPYVPPNLVNLMTGPFLEKIRPDHSLGDARFELERSALLKRIDDATARIITLESDLALALDALKELAGSAQMAVTALEGEEVIS